jgi:hypothetical protein
VYPNLEFPSLARPPRPTHSHHPAISRSCAGLTKWWITGRDASVTAPEDQCLIVGAALFDCRDDSTGPVFPSDQIVRVVVSLKLETNRPLPRPHTTETSVWSIPNAICRSCAVLTRQGAMLPYFDQIVKVTNSRVVCTLSSYCICP